MIMAIDANFIIDNQHRLEGDEASFFGPEPVDVLPASATMLDALVKAGIFPSKSEARKNWKGPIEIPDGFSEWVVGKLKNRMTILKPVFHNWTEQEMKEWEAEMEAQYQENLKKPKPCKLDKVDNS